jgi:hypothetical protein
LKARWTWTNVAEFAAAAGAGADTTVTADTTAATAATIQFRTLTERVRIGRCKNCSSLFPGSSVDPGQPASIHNVAVDTKPRKLFTRAQHRCRSDRSILGDMAKSAGASKPAKLTRAEKKEMRIAKRRKRRETWRSMGQAFNLTRKQDPKFLPYLVLFPVLAAAALYLIVFFVTGSAVFGIPFAVFGLLIVAMLVFSRRAQSAMYSQAEGQPGAAGWLLQQQLKGDWRLTQGVAGTASMDAVHRLIGRPGIVLVGEGAPHRVRGLIAQEKKKIARVAGDTPIYDITVGTGEGDVRLGKLNRYLIKLPSNLSKGEVSALERRLGALGGPRAPLPKGPMPQGAKMRNVQRTVRRRS